MGGECAEKSGQPVDDHDTGVRVVDCRGERLEGDVDQLPHPEADVLLERPFRAYEHGIKDRGAHRRVNWPWPDAGQRLLGDQVFTDPRQQNHGDSCG